jgi:rhamnose utilization protein RhaD (predicted bifunctional aldolase and dehydrogenase)
VNVAYAELQKSRVSQREILAFRDLSARIGRDPLLIQGNNGNTSIKLNGTLWIKASGKSLAQAKHEEILVPVDLDAARKAVEQNVEMS